VSTAAIVALCTASPQAATYFLTEEPMNKYSDEQIRNYAHQLWKNSGRPEGKFDEFRRQAEIELDAQGEGECK
jgi:Protein of unknown function (DUF2934)